MERNVFSSDKIQHYINILTTNSPKTANDYYILRKFSILEIQSEKFLIDKKHRDTASPPIYVSCGDVNRYIKSAHERCFHAGIKKTYSFVKKDAANVKLTQVKRYMANCKYCLSIKNKQGYKKIAPVIKQPIITQKYGQRGQVDLIDVKQFGQNKCSFILNYQDNLTRFCALRPLKNKTTESVIPAIIDVFCTFGAPKYLQSDNGGEFKNKKFIATLKKYWPELEFIYGKAYNPRSQGAIERCNRDVKNMILCYIDIHQTNFDLVRILPFIQYSKNISFNRSMKCSAFNALLGQEPLLGLKSEYLLNDHGGFDDDAIDDEEEEENIKQREASIEKCRDSALQNIRKSASQMIEKSNRQHISS